MPYLKSVLRPGSIHVFRGICRVAGEKSRSAAAFKMEQPGIYKPEEYANLQGTLQPRYALTAGLTNHMVAKAVRGALEDMEKEGGLREFLPEEVRSQYRLISWADALRQIHCPNDQEEAAGARRRLAFQEFLSFFLGLQRLKADNQVRKVKDMLYPVPDTGRLLDALPYRLTGAQMRVWKEIEGDLCKGSAMNRLVQGDVGSGKTILAFLALLLCAANGKQGCLMAPTEVLACQHYEALCKLKEDYGLCVEPLLLTGSMTAKEKREGYRKAASGEANVIIGTHALIQGGVEYQNLALAVTDEQHRFGVRQRETLADKGEGCHVLVMSATPIPRTLAIVLYGDLHVSIVDELPAGRRPIKNCVVGTAYRPKAYSFLKNQVEAGHQVYCICPMVEEGEMEGLENVTDYAITASIVEEAWDGQTYGGGNDIHYPSMIKWIKNTDGSWRFDYTHFDKWVELNLEIGIADKIICYSMMPWDNVVKYTDEASGTMMQMRAQPGNAVQYAEVWQPFMEDFVRHLDEKGWFDRTYIGFDERTGMATALNLIDSVQNKDGNVLKKSAAFNDFQSNKAVFDRLDSASVGLQQIRDHLEGFKQQIVERRDNGKELTLYTATEHVPNSFTKSNPVESYWTIMYAGSLNTTGFLRWAYDAWVEDPLEESTHWSFPAGDCFLVYPSEKDAEVKESKFSIRLAKLNEGVRDINKLYMMREEYPELAAKADKILENVSGDEIGDYEYSTMAPTDSWGRQAKWLTEKGKKDMLSDMAAVKQGLYEFTKEYTTKKYPGTIQEIEILGADEKEFECGETLQLSMRVEPSTAAQSEVSWSSSNPSVASVDGKGLVTMKSAGEAVITAASAENANIMQSIKVRVVSSEAKEELNRQTDAIAKLPKDKYTADTWKKVEVALAEANAVLKKTDATPQEIKIALDNLKKAVDGLKLAEAKPPVDIPVKPTPALEKGKEYSVGALKYVILSTSPAKAALSGSKSKSLKTLKMTPEVTVNGVKCKVTGIQAKAFRNCRNLKSAVIGANVTTIGKQAFYGCKKLSKINFKGKKAPKLGKQAFKGTAKKVKVLAVKMKKKQRQAFMKKLKKAGMRTIK